MVVSDIKYRNR